MLEKLNSHNLPKADEELRVITFETLENIKISHGDLYWKKGNGKLVKLLHSGDHLDFSKLEKFKKVTNALYISEVCSEEFISIGEKLLEKLVETNSEIDRLSYRHQLLEFVGDVYWHGNENESLLSLIVIFKNTLYDISPKFEEEMEEQAMSIFRRSSLYATLVTLSALAAGYTHGSFLKDLYNISFFNDFSCARSLNKHQDSDHVNKSVSEFEKSKFYELKNKSLSRLISFHHEDFRGNGENIGLIFDELSELERISIFIEQTIPHYDFMFSRNDGANFLNKLFKVEEEDSYQLKRFKEDIKKEFFHLSKEEIKAS